jgi:DNA phosphorothioation-dependent restriction protein DptF
MGLLALRQALTVLSKSSPYAVTTEAELQNSEFDVLKKCIYVETDVEIYFKQCLDQLKSKGSGILFLCGSSGDGKSEILTKYKSEYDQYVDFHLDATHSFSAKTSAIQTLDETFSHAKDSGRPLVVGINIGMLGNYERDGSEKHANLKLDIKEFLDQNINLQLNNASFISFESFPKFEIDKEQIKAEFFSALLDRVVRDDQGNKFTEYYNQALHDSKDTRLIENFTLLRDKFVQKEIIGLLLAARIKKDQFITARMLLDFIYCILTGPDLLFDNIFNGGDNELLNAISDYDPSLIRNEFLDQFLLHNDLELLGGEYAECINEITAKYSISNKALRASGRTLIRMFYILRNVKLNSAYSNEFNKSFADEGMSLYRELWAAHNEFDGDKEKKRELKRYYENTIKPAIRLYVNRNKPELPKTEYFLSSHGSNYLSTEIDISIDFDELIKQQSSDISHFNLCLKIDGETLKPIPVGVNLLSLMQKIVLGYRPNKHDKNSVVLLEDLASHIVSLGISSPILKLHVGNKAVTVKNTQDGDIEVSGI